jgi:hypothetical protein
MLQATRTGQSCRRKSAQVKLHASDRIAVQSQSAVAMQSNVADGTLSPTKRQIDRFSGNQL